MMGLRKIVFFVVCTILFHVLMPTGLAGRLGAEGLFLGLGDYSMPASPNINEDTVEQMWLNCSLDLMDLKEVIKDSEFSLLEEIIRDGTRFLAKVSAQEFIALLSPETKHTFLDCLSKKNFPFHVSGEESGRNSFAEFFESLFGWHPASRRHLADQAFQHVAPSLPPAPAPALAPVVASAPSPSPGIDPPSYGPSPSSVPAPTSVPAPNYISPSHGYSIPDDSPVLPLRKQNKTDRSVVIAAVIVAAGASFLAAFLSYCLCCGNKKNSGHGRKDDRPFLNLTSSDFSGSSQNSFGLENSINNNKFAALSFKNDPTRIGHVSTVDIKSVETPPSAVLPGLSNSSTEPLNASSNAPAPKPPPLPQRPPPVPPPPPPNSKNGAFLPPPPKGAFPPRPPQTNSRVNQLGNAVSSEELDVNADTSTPKPKLKPFFWDKVLANPDHSMVWDQIKSGSFQFNEEKIESLFGYPTAGNRKGDGKKESSFNDPSTQYVRILDPKKSQNLAISIKALNVKTEEVCDALMEGNELPMELLQTLLRTAPSPDEELKLRLYSGDHSLLGPAEQFLKALVDVPFAFQRMDVLLFMASLPEEVSIAKESFSTLELACNDLRSSRLFLKLLEAVLKTGNRMNDGTFRGGAQAFKLDTLLKLDIKGSDGKTTLLHFVVQEVIRSEGVRAARLAREAESSSSLNSDDLTDDSASTESGEYFRSLGLEAVSGLSNELENVKKAASLDADTLTSTVANLVHRMAKAKEFLNTDMRSVGEESGFHRSLECFVESAETDITSLQEEENRIRSLVKKTTDYFHGNAGRDEGLRLFVIARDFLGMLDKTCKEVVQSTKKVPSMENNRKPSTTSSARDPRKLIFPAIRDRRVDSFSSDDESP